MKWLRRRTRKSGTSNQWKNRFSQPISRLVFTGLGGFFSTDVVKSLHFSKSFKFFFSFFFFVFVRKLICCASVAFSVADVNVIRCRLRQRYSDLCFRNLFGFTDRVLSCHVSPERVCLLFILPLFSLDCHLTSCESEN